MGFLEDAYKGLKIASDRNKQTEAAIDESLGEKSQPVKRKDTSIVGMMVERNKEVDRLLDDIDKKPQEARNYVESIKRFSDDLIGSAKQFSEEKLGQVLQIANEENPDADLINDTRASLKANEVGEGEKKGVFKSILDSLNEIPDQANAGMQIAVKNAIQSISDVIDLVGDTVGTDYKLNEKVEGFLEKIPEFQVGEQAISSALQGKSVVIPKAETVTGEVAKTAAKYAVGLIPFLRAFKFVAAIPKAGRLLQTGLAGGAAAFTVLEPDTPKFTELISSLHPKIRIPFQEYLSASENDTNVEKRFKNAVDDGIGFGAIGGLFFSLGKLLKNAGIIGRKVRGTAPKVTKASELADGIADKIEVEEAIIKRSGGQRTAKGERRLLGLAEFQSTEKRIAQIEKTNIKNLRKKDVDFIDRHQGKFSDKVVKQAEKLEPQAERRIRRRRGAEQAEFSAKTQMLQSGKLNAQQRIGDLKHTQKKFAAHTAAKEGKFTQSSKLVQTTKGAPKGVDPVTEKLFKEFQVTTGEGDIGINIKSDNFHLEADIQTSYNKVAKLFKEDVKAAKDVPLTREKVKALAEEHGFSVEDIMEMNAGQPLFPHQIKAFKFHVAQSIEKINKLSDLWRAGDKSVEVELRREIALAGHMIPKFESAGTVSSNMLREFKLDPDLNLKLLKQVGNTIEEIPVGANMEQLMDALTTLPKTIKAKSMFARIMSTGADMFREAWIAAMVSGTKTLIAVNPLGNLNLLMFGLQERAIARGISMVFSGGKKGIAPKETHYLAYGMINSVREAIEVAGKTLKSGIQSPEFSKFAIPKAMSSENVNLSFIKNETAQNYLKWGIDALGWTIRTPFNVLGATDDFFKVLNTRGHLYALGARKAFKNGHVPESDDFIRTVREVTENPTEAIKNEATEFGHYQTFTNQLNKDRGFIEASGAYITEFANQHLLAKIIAPFSRIATNITKYTLERTPLAFAMHDFQMAFKAGGAQKQLAFAKIALGSMYGGFFAYLAHSGLISGNYPTGSLTQNRLKTEAGFPKNAFLVGGKAHPIRRVDIIGSHMAAAADLVEMSETLDIDTMGEMATGLSVMISENVLSKSYLTGVADVIEVLLGKKNASTVFQRFSGTLFPFSSAVRELSRAIDPTERVINPKAGIWESFRDGYIKGKPFLKDLYLLPKRGFFGEVIKRARYFDTMNQKDNPALDALIENEVKVAYKPSRVIAGNAQGRLKPPSPEDGIELTNEQYDKLRENFGTVEIGGLIVQEQIEQVIKQPLFKSASKGQKAQILESIIHTYRSVAEEKLKQDDEGLRELINLKMIMKLQGE